MTLIIKVQLEYNEFRENLKSKGISMRDNIISEVFDNNNLELKNWVSYSLIAIILLV